ncbi:MAG: triose-phosphate isomerase [Firmicutes bacterium]|nr:triose-phosphate isomerase [Bacillota bacterium]
MATRQRLIAGNWKMYKTRAEAVAFAKELTSVAGTRKAGVNWPQAVICAPFTALYGLAEAFAASGVSVGAQTMHQAPEGAYTGDVAVSMLRDLDVTFVILGHSERRLYCAETDAAVAEKSVVALKAAGLTPIVCVGETLADREEGRTQSVIAGQLDPVFTALGQSGIAAASLSRLVIAYEPIWAIGTGRSSSAADAQDVIGAIRTLTNKHFGREIAQAVRILYGGSVKPENIALYLGESDIDGALVGGASLQVSSFVELLEQSKGD